MSTKEIADRLVALCEKGEFEKAQKELYADDVVSIEPVASPGFEKETKGLDNVIAKGHKFQEMTEKLYGIEISSPLITDSAIAFRLTLDAAMKGRGRQQMNEICVYEVKDGKIASECFYM